VGYGEIHPLTDTGRIFTIFLIISGMVVFGVVIGELTRSLIEGEIRDFMEKKRTTRTIEKLKDHYIICGYGRIGKVIANELSEHNVPFVVIDSSADVAQEISKKGYPSINGDSVQEEVLLSAGIERAKGLIAAVGSTADNVYITISAKALNPAIYVMGRAHDEITEKRLRAAGADQAVCPYSIGGRRMANILIRPAVVEFMDLTIGSKDFELGVEELRVSPDSRFIGKSIVDSEIRTAFGAIIVAIARPNEKTIFNPPPHSIILQGDTLIVLGELKKLKLLSSAVSGRHKEGPA
jgi:voltage-gated potassium channel